jgi:hypothetical protein
MQKPDELEESVVELITNQNVSDLVIEGLDLGVDALIESEALEKIPIVGTLARLCHAGFDIKSYLFLRKIKNFLLQLQRVSADERKAFNERIAADNVYREKVGSSLLLILDKLDDLNKSVLVAKAFAAHVRGRITFDIFRRFSSAIDRCLIADLMELKGYSNDIDQSYVAHVLAASGLLEIKPVGSMFGGGNPINYVISDLGRIFVKEVLEMELTE